MERRTHTRMTLRSLGLALCPLLAARLAAQDATPTPLARELIVGRVASEGGAALPGAVVSITRGPDRALQRDTTDASGRFAVLWTEGTGDYLVHIAAVGHVAFRKRVQRAGPGDTVFVVDAILKPQVQELAAVRVRIARQKPAREVDPMNAPVGGGQQPAEGLTGALPPELAGDIAALASTTPGIVSLPAGGFSALGLPAGQSTVTLDGMGFNGASLPGEARPMVTVATSPYDVSRGGFSGAEVSLRLASPGLYSRRTGSLAVDAPFLQATDWLGRQLGVPYTQFQGGIGAAGPLGRDDRYDYNVALQVNHRVSDAVSLLDAPGEVLQRSGITADTLAVLERTLRGLQIPVDRWRGGQQRSDQVVALARFGWAPTDWVSRDRRTRSGAVTAYLQARQADGLNTSLSALPTQRTRGTAATGALQALYSQYLGPQGDRLLEIRTAFNAERERSDPVVPWPVAHVLVGTGGRDDLGNPIAGVTPVGFGGATTGTARSRLTWATRSELQWFATPRHKTRLHVESQVEQVARETSQNDAGRYWYNTLADLAANRPAVFSRPLSVPTQFGRVWTGALSAGDIWVPTSRLSVVYGMRLDGNRYLSRPRDNPAVREAFGAGTAFVPDRASLSPRIGFTYRLNRGDAEPASISYSSLGQFVGRPRGYVRGGIGRFGSAARADLVAAPWAFTGLGDAYRALTCIGDAVPIPDWEEIVGGGGAIPGACATGTRAESQADAAPQIVLIDREYAFPESWRMSLGATSLWARTSISVDGVLSVNRHQPGRVDLNVRGDPVWYLPEDGGRAVYVPLDQIVPSSGAVSPVASRRDGSFGAVTSLRSDLSSVSRALTASLRPQLPSDRHLSLTYTLSDTRAWSRGFDGGAFGRLAAREYSRSDFDVRHTFVLATGARFDRLGGLSLTLHTLLRSGLPYTPLVSADVNGDGRANDRAFVVDPDAAEARRDTRLAAEMRALLMTASASARDCLRTSLGRTVARNGCEGPWTATMNARLTLPWTFVPTAVTGQRRVAVALNLANPLGGVDYLLHGSRARGWGAVAAPDPVLYSVTGFDPGAPRYLYRVNPRFGSSRSARTGSRAPFRVTLELVMNLGRPTEEQQVHRMLGPGRLDQGRMLDSAELRRRYARATPNVYLMTLRMADSLLLTRAQVQALREDERPYLARVDSLWGSLAADFARLPRAFDAAAALRRQEATVEAGWEVNKVAARRIKEILTPLQFSLASGLLQSLAATATPVRIRFF